MSFDDERVITKVSSTADIDAKVVAATQLYHTVFDKDFVATNLNIRCTNLTIGSKAVQAVISAGNNSPNFNNFIPTTTITVTVAGTVRVVRPVNATEFTIQGNDTDIKLNITTGSDATTETWAADLFGYVPV